MAAMMDYSLIWQLTHLCVSERVCARRSKVEKRVKFIYFVACLCVVVLICSPAKPVLVVSYYHIHVYLLNILDSLWILLLNVCFSPYALAVGNISICVI